MRPGSYGSGTSLRNPSGHFSGGSGGAGAGGSGNGGPSFGFDMQLHQQHPQAQGSRRKFGDGSGMEEDDQARYYPGKKRKASTRTDDEEDPDDQDQDDDDENDNENDDDVGSMNGGNHGSSSHSYSHSHSRGGKRTSRGLSSGAGDNISKDSHEEKTHPSRPKKPSNSNGNGTGKERPGRGKGMRRGARACTNCRRGKNRCEGDDPCLRCKAQGLECVFAKPAPKPQGQNGNGNTIGGGSNGMAGGSGQQNQFSQQQQLRVMNNMHMNPGMSMVLNGVNAGNGMQQGWGNSNSMGDPEGRFMHIESSVNHLAASQNQMQSTLSQILSALSNNQMNNGMSHSSAPQLQFAQPSPPRNNGMGSANSQGSMSIGHQRDMSGADLYGMNHLAPPDTGESARLDPFSPGTVAALTEVAVANGFTGAGTGLGRDEGAMDNNEVERNSVPRSGSMNGNRVLRDDDGFAWPAPPVPKSAIAKIEDDVELESKPKIYPKLPGFKPPPHRYANYGLVVSSTAASSDDESEDTLPRSSLNAPIEALHQLANAADQAAKENAQFEAENRRQGFLSPPRVLQNQLKFKRMKKPDPAPRNAFPDVVTKGLVAPEEARELWDMSVACQDRSGTNEQLNICQTDSSRDVIISSHCSTRITTNTLALFREHLSALMVYSQSLPRFVRVQVSTHSTGFANALADIS